MAILDDLLGGSDPSTAILGALLDGLLGSDSGSLGGSSDPTTPTT